MKVILNKQRAINLYSAAATLMHTWPTVALCLLLAACSVVNRQTIAQTTNAPPSTPNQQQTKRLSADPNKFAIIISGASGDETYAQQFTEWNAQLRQALTERLAFAEENIRSLTEKPAENLSPAPGIVAATSSSSPQGLRATAENVQKAFETLRPAARSDATLFVFFIGHGTFDGRQAKFNLVGPDLPASTYAKLIKELPMRRAVIINMSSASGEFIKPLAATGHIIVTATRSGQEQNATRFPQHFIEALSKPDADTDQNGRISILEAFNYATRLTAEWYKTENRLASEHALLEDNGDGVGHQTAEAGDGLLAKSTYFDSLPALPAGASANNAEVARLITQRTRLEEEVEQVKRRKDGMKPEEYDATLEKALIELAKVSRTIRTQQK